MFKYRDRGEMVQRGGAQCITQSPSQLSLGLFIIDLIQWKTSARSCQKKSSMPLREKKSSYVFHLAPEP